MSSEKEVVDAGTAREFFSELVNRAAFGKERVVLGRRGKALAAVVPLEDLALLEKLEDHLDAAEAQEALAEWEATGRPFKPLAEVAKALGVKL
jgi:prevent-host-death family protein